VLLVLEKNHSWVIIVCKVFIMCTSIDFYLRMNLCMKIFVPKS
jgi:hypothetical protein